jgi:hypothetical protein
MADQLATPADLASFLQLGAFASLSQVKQDNLTMLVELATAKVQRAAGGQRILAATSTAVIDLDIDYDDQYVSLPQQPVRALVSAKLDGNTLTDVYLRMGMLWRWRGWSTSASVPPQLVVTTAHGLKDGDQGLQYARSTVLELARGGYGNPTGATSKAIDDYRVTYAEADARMVLPAPTADGIAAQYGTQAYVSLSRS